MASKKTNSMKKAGIVMDGFFSGAGADVTEEKDSQESVNGLNTASETDVTEEDSSQESVSGFNTAKKPTKKNTKGKKEETKEEPQKGRKTDSQKVFSFRADKEAVDSWRVWAIAKGVTVNELGEKALTEYIRRHGLTADQKQIYELKMAQKKS